MILKANEKWFISLWNYKTTTSRYDTIMRKAGTRGDWFMFQTSDAYSSGNIGMRFNYNYYSVSAGAMPLNAWTHIYVDNDGAGNVSIYVNVVKKASKLINVDFDMSDGIALGGKDYGGTTGYIDELVIGVGRQLYAADFTPPTAPYTADSVVAVDTNMMIRHNNANCYIPLTTDKSKTSVPCLSIRHGNTNYYAIK